MTTAGDAGLVEMRIAKVVGLGTKVVEPSTAQCQLFHIVVLDEPSGDRHLLIEFGQAEALSLAAHLDGRE